MITCTVEGVSGSEGREGERGGRECHELTTMHNIKCTHGKYSWLKKGEKEGGKEGGEGQGERLTVLTPSMSNPLAAKSVASKKLTFPSLNSFSASSLCNTAKSHD